MKEVLDMFASVDGSEVHVDTCERRPVFVPKLLGLANCICEVERREYVCCSRKKMAGTETYLIDC